MKEYEVVREIFNQCSGNQMRDVFVQEVEIDDIDAFMDQYRTGSDVTEDRFEESDGSIVYDMVNDGLHQRITFQEA